MCNGCSDFDHVTTVGEPCIHKRRGKRERRESYFQGKRKEETEGTSQ